MGQVGLPEIALVDLRLEAVAVGLGAAVDGVMLGRGHHFEVLGVVALQTADEGHPHAAGEIGILAVSLHTPSPARVAEQVDVGRPEGQPLIEAAPPLPGELVVLGPGFVGDRRGHPSHKIAVPGGGQADGLGEDRGQTGPGHAMQGLAPPVIGRDTEALHRGRRVHHLADLLLEGHSGDEVVDPLVERGVGVQVDGLAFAAFGAAGRGDQNPRRQDQEERKEKDGTIGAHGASPGEGKVAAAAHQTTP